MGADSKVLAESDDDSGEGIGGLGRAPGGARSYSCCQVTDTNERSSGGGTPVREDE